MKAFGITAFVVILLMFGMPLLGVKDDYKYMEYEEIGDVMLNNIEPYITTLETVSVASESILEVGEKVIDGLGKLTEWANKVSEYQNKIFNAIADFIKGIYQKLTGTTCTGSYDDGWSCATSDGGGGGNFGGR